MQSQIAERAGFVWSPDDPLDLLSVSVDGICTAFEWEGMLAINKAGRDWLGFKITTEQYLEILHGWGIVDPYELLNEFSDHVEAILACGNLT